MVSLRIPTIPAVLAAVLVLLAGAALAQGGPPAGGRGPGGGCGGGMFASIDANGDGRIGRDEFQAHVESMFAIMDQKQDGKVTRDEYTGLRMGPGGGMGPRAAGRQARKAANFEAVDTNHDGAIDGTEFTTWKMARFDKADSGHAGMLTPRQFCTMDR